MKEIKNQTEGELSYNLSKFSEDFTEAFAIAADEQEGHLLKEADNVGCTLNEIVCELLHRLAVINGGIIL